MRVLVPYDGSPQSEAALDHAIETYPDAAIVALFVVDPVERLRDEGHLPKSFEDVRREATADHGSVGKRVDDILSAAEQRAADHDREIETVVEPGHVARTVVEVAEELPADGIVIGSHARNLAARILLGSTAEDVVRHANVPVTVVR